MTIARRLYYYEDKGQTDNEDDRPTVIGRLNWSVGRLWTLDYFFHASSLGTSMIHLYFDQCILFFPSTFLARFLTDENSNFEQLGLTTTHAF